MGAGTPGPGWYPDPRLVYEERFWDGERWTDRVRGERHKVTAQEKQASREAHPEAAERARAPEQAAAIARGGRDSHDVTARIDELARNRLTSRLGVGRELRKLPGLLLDGEEVLNLARGRYDARQGIIVVTDRRVMFVEEGMTRSRLEDFPYAKLSSVQSQTGMLSGKLQIFASGNKAEIDTVIPKERATEIGDYVRHRIAEPHVVSTAPGPPGQTAAVASQPDVMDQLKKLGELRDAGILTADEFESKKAELLSRL